jgi:hypothetical protein
MLQRVNPLLNKGSESEKSNTMSSNLNRNILVLGASFLSGCASNVLLKKDGEMIYGQKFGRVQYLEEKDKDIGVVKKIVFDNRGNEGEYSLNLYRHDQLIQKCSEPGWKKVEASKNNGVMVMSPLPGGGMMMTGGGSEEAGTGILAEPGPSAVQTHTVECSAERFPDTVYVDVLYLNQKMARYKLITQNNDPKSK